MNGGVVNGGGTNGLPGTAPVRVMICDDSATVRGILARLLGEDPAIEVVSRVGDGRQAVEGGVGGDARGDG